MLFDEGMEHWWAGDRAAACRFYRKALTNQPDHSDAHNHLGIAALDRGRLKDAERHFDAAIAGATADRAIEHGQTPPGHPQIEYHPESRQWSPRGDVLRAVISCDVANEPCMIIDGRELSLAELGRMLSTYEGWGARITFVPDDELHQQPLIEVRQPDGDEG